jgi:hypothetical protein
MPFYRSGFMGVTTEGVWIGYWIYWPTYTHHSVIQVITGPPLISILHKSLLQTVSRLQSAVSSTAVP